MSFVNAGPSPAVLGVVAALSFGALVVAAFTSGYHLAGRAATADVAGAELAAQSSPSAANSSSDDLAGSAAQAAAFAPIEGRVAEPLVDRDKAVLLAAPENGDVVDELPSGRAVTISRESGDWLFVSYERDGRPHEGWAHRINIEREEP